MMPLQTKAKDWALRMLATTALAKKRWSQTMGELAGEATELLAQAAQAPEKTAPWALGILSSFERLARSEAGKFRRRAGEHEDARARVQTSRERVFFELLAAPPKRGLAGAFDLGMASGKAARAGDEPLRRLFGALSLAPAKSWLAPSELSNGDRETLSRADVACGLALSREPSRESIALVKALAQSGALGLSRATGWAFANGPFRVGRVPLRAPDVFESFELSPNLGWRQAILDIAIDSGNSAWEAHCVAWSIPQPVDALPKTILSRPMAMPLALLFGTAEQAAQAWRANPDPRGPGGFPLGAVAALSSKDQVEKLRLLSSAGVDVFMKADWDAILVHPKPWLDFCAAGQHQLVHGGVFSSIDLGMDKHESPQEKTRWLLETIRERQSSPSQPNMEHWAATMAKSQPLSPKGALDDQPMLWPQRRVDAVSILFYKENFAGLRGLREIDQAACAANDAMEAAPPFSLEALDEARACGWDARPAPWWIGSSGWRSPMRPFIATEATLEELARCEAEGWLEDDAARQAALRTIEGGAPDRGRSARWLLEWNEEAFLPEERRRLWAAWERHSQHGDEDWAKPVAMARLEQMKIAREESRALNEVASTVATPKTRGARL